MMEHAGGAPQHDDDIAPVLERFRRIGLQSKDRPQHEGLARASVLVPLFVRNDNNDSSSIYVLLTQRPTTLRTHAGEVCFPGGKQDDEDCQDDVVTALREAREEVGLSERAVQPLGESGTAGSLPGKCPHSAAVAAEQLAAGGGS